MALVLSDRVQETGTVTTGTGSVTLAGAVNGYQSFTAGVGNSNTCYYTIYDPTAFTWEVGIGTYTTSPNTLARTTILASSNSGSLVSFSTVNTLQIWVDYPSEKAVYLNASGNVSALGTITSGVWNGTTIAVGYGGTGATATPTNGQLLIGNGTNFTVATVGSGTGISTTVGSGTLTINNTGVTSFNAGTTGLTPNSATSGAITLAGTLAVANGGTGVTSSSGANSVVLRDANANVAANSFTPGWTATATAAGTTTLTVASTYYQRFTGTTTQTVVLPAANTVALGQGFIIDNDSTGNVTLQDGTPTTLLTIVPGMAGFIFCENNGSVAGSWSGYQFVPGTGPSGAVTWGTAGLAMGGGALSGVSTINMSGQLTNTVATGTAPFVVSSTTQVANLNAATAGSAGSVTNSATFNNSGTGAASGTTYNGSAAQTISYNTVGASPLAGSSSLTTVGTVTSGIWNATVIGIAYGGTNSTATPTAGGVGYGTGTAHAYSAAGTSGQALISAGAGAPAFGALAIGTANTNVSGALTVTNGGTGAATLTGYVYGNGTSAMTASTTIPTSALSGNFVSTFSGGTTGLTPSTATAGAVTLAGTLAIANGGTGSTTAATVAGTGISVSGTFPNQTVTNSGVTSNVAGTGISVSGATGAVTITNSGVTSAVAGTGVSVSGSTGAVTFSIGQAVATSSNVQFNSLGINTGASGTAGEIRATNNITAYYSDIRLKNVTGLIADAVYKVKLLRGFTYTNNDMAATYGYTTKEEQVGLSAQEVQTVLPQVVTAAPFDIAQDVVTGKEYSKSGENFLTVRYERVVPLLVEAIKELSVYIDDLKAEVAELKNPSTGA